MMRNSGSTGGSTAVAATPLNRGPQPGWMTLNDARDRAFTGEIAFEIEPEVRVYVDNGVVYFAERSTDSPLAQRLLQAGLVDHGQLERGTVRVGDVEHLGRLFDRDATVDRDAVLVATETQTEAIIAEIANEAVCTVRSTAYRHHPSGLHRWFATPLDAADRAFGVSSYDANATGEVPCLPIVTERTLADQLYIEWDEPIIGGARTADETLVEEFDDSILQAMLDESSMQYDVIESDDVAEIDRAAEITTVEIDYIVTDVHSEEVFFDEWAVENFDAASIETAPAVVAPVHKAPARAEDVGSTTDGDEFVVAWPNAVNGVTATTPIETWDEEIVAEVPTEVAAAVKRAIAALERVTGEVPIVAPIEQPSEFTEPNPPIPSAAAAPTVGGFAPPSLETSAEALYARATAQLEADTQVDAAADPVGFDDTFWDEVPADRTAANDPAGLSMTVEHAAPAGVASVMFGDDVAPGHSGGDSNERSSALRRLIGSLRRKDR
jgi:hypothetical protein